MELIIAQTDPATPDVVALLNTHLAFAHTHTPQGHVHALDLERLRIPEVSFFAGRINGELMATGALKRLSVSHGEIKSMHTAERARGQGVGRAMVERLIAFAGESGFERVSLETGTMDAFAPARALYRSVGFTQCKPFGDYTENEFSICMTMELT